MMNRREALKVVLAGGALLAACARESDVDDQTLLEEIADTLLPSTPSSPGAKAANVGPTMNLLLTECYKEEDRRNVRNGLAEFRSAKFTTLPRAQREQFIRRVGDANSFHLVRELATAAYFSSEIGLTKALRYTQTPGRWIGCVPLQPGQPAWG